MTVSLITGCAGFLGSHVCDHLLRAGHTVIGLDDLSGGKRENVPDGVEFVVESVTHEGRLNWLMKHYQPDYIFHFAAYAAETLSHRIRRHNYNVNLIGSVNLINAAVNAGTVKRFVFASSAAVYGTTLHPAREYNDPAPVDPYGIAKYAVEMDLEAAREQFGLLYTVFRFHNIYGERQNLSDPHRNAIAIFMRQGLLGQPMTVYGDGSQTRQFTYVTDVVQAIVRCLDVPEAARDIYNVGSDERTTILAAAQATACALNIEPSVTFLPARQEVQHVQLWHSRAKDYLGVTCDTPLSDGLARMAHWARTQILTDPRPFEAIEITKGLS